MKFTLSSIAFFLVIVIGQAILASGVYDSTKSSHDTLFTDAIDNKNINDENIDLEANLVGPGKQITIQDIFASGSVTAGAITADSITIGSQLISSILAGADPLWGKSANDIFYTSGKVGIGMGNPQTPLHISSFQDANIRLQDMDSSNGGTSAAYLEFFNPSLRIGFIGLPGDSVNGDYLKIATEQGKHIAIMPDGAGNVGIGTSTPSQKLDVAGTVRATAFQGDGSGLQGVLLSTGGTLNGAVALPPNGLSVGGNQLIVSGGNVGIGTASSPSERLEVDGTVKATAFIGTFSGSGASLTDLPEDTTKVNKAGDTMTGALNLPADGLVVGTSQLVVSGGKVGIGVASPAYDLDVAGTIRSTGNILAPNIGPASFSRIVATALHKNQYDGTGPNADYTLVSAQCPVSTTLITWGAQGHHARTSGTYSYCDCLQDGNGVQAKFLSDVPTNDNYYCSCFGLCLKN